MWPATATDAERRASEERFATPWGVAWHALEVLDYDLTGEFATWVPPPPFAGHPHWQITQLQRPWTGGELLGYVDYCRRRVHETLSAATDLDGARPLPARHRYAGQPHAWLIVAAVGHTAEHAAQIRQFTARAATPGQ